jgi:hypothetical protein
LTACFCGDQEQKLYYEVYTEVFARNMQILGDRNRAKISSPISKDSLELQISLGSQRAFLDLQKDSLIPSTYACDGPPAPIIVFEDPVEFVKVFAVDLNDGSKENLTRFFRPLFSDYRNGGSSPSLAYGDSIVFPFNANLYISEPDEFPSKTKFLIEATLESGKIFTEETKVVEFTD